MRVVIDTNVWISAFLVASGAPGLLVRHVIARGQPVFTEETYQELEQRLWLPKFDKYLSIEDRRNLLVDLNGLAHWVEVPSATAVRRYSRDLTDDKFVHAALAAQATWLITGDLDLLEMDPVAGLTIVAPAAALALPAFQT